MVYCPNTDSQNVLALSIEINAKEVLQRLINLSNALRERLKFPLRNRHSLYITRHSRHTLLLAELGKTDCVTSLAKECLVFAILIQIIYARDIVAP